MTDTVYFIYSDEDSRRFMDTFPPSANRLIIKGGTGLSLHERFTRLNRVPLEPPAPAPAPAAPRFRDDLDLYSPPRVSNGILRGTTTYYEEERDVTDMFSPPKIHPALSLRRSMDMYDSRESHDRRHLFHTAMRIKKRAITQRLGARARLGGYPEVPRYQTRGRYRWRGRGLGRPRWATSYTPGRYGGGFRRRGGGRGRGGGYFGRGRGRGGFRSRRGRGRYGPQISKEELDKQLDAYMKDTKSILDKEIDNYMNEAAAAK